MDDLKLYVKNESGVEGFLKQFELNRCTKATLRNIKMVKKTNVKLNLDSIIQKPEQEKIPKYKTVNGESGIQHASMKEKIWN